MSKVELSDKQAVVVHTLSGPLFVSAGAGAGKTFTLTQRIRYAMLPGSKPREQWADPTVPEPFLDSIDQVLAITFTEKAATELKDRIRGMLLDEGMTAEADKVDSSWISTIHSMCSRIIRAHAFDQGLDPAFALEGYADDLKRLAVEHVLRRVSAEAEGDNKGAYNALLEAFDLEPTGESHDLNNLMSILIAMLSKLAATVGGFDAFECVRPRVSRIEVYEAYKAIADTPSYANCEAAALAVRALDEFFASSQDLPALRACHADCGKLTLPRGKDKDKLSEREFVLQVRDARSRFFAEAYLEARADAMDELVPLAREVRDEYDRLKDERSSLDNDDLLTRAYDALKTDPLVRAEFAGKFKMVMVDEFQDTAQQQVELVRLLCSPDARELCTVGDAQQSIYRFRGADVSVFRSMKVEVEAAPAGVVATLDANFRSHADILEFADRIFWGENNRLGRDFLHLESCGEENRKDPHPLRSPDTSRHQLALVVGGDADARSREKATQIAQRFKRLIAEEGFCPGDMVILMKALSKADLYASTLREAGIPCVVAGGTSVFRKAPEVGVVRALLAFLANPNDGQNGTLPLLASPLFALGAQELLALATYRESVADVVDSRSLTADVLLGGEVLSEFGQLPLLDRARQILKCALERVGREPVSQTCAYVLNESGWLYRLEHGGASEHAQAANVLKALEIVRAEEVGRAFAPRVVADAVAKHIDTVKESPGTLNGAGADAVRIMTIHASKGLEFPVVAVAECDSVAPDKSRFRTCEENGTTYWCAFPSKYEVGSDDCFYEGLADVTFEEGEPDRGVPERAADAFIYMRKRDAELEFDELARLFYVAITRAREVVILAMGAQYGTELKPGHKSSLVGDVLSHVLPADDSNAGLPDLGADRLDFPDAHAGDYSIAFLDDVCYPDKKGRCYAAADYPSLSMQAERGDAADVQANDGRGSCEGSHTETMMESAASDVVSASVPREDARTVDVVYPQAVATSIGTLERPPRDSYSYSSISAALHEQAEDRVERANRASEDAGAAGENSTPLVAAGDPTALGSAFHAAAQWLIETGCVTVPAERIDALAHYWRVTPEQRGRLQAALARWEGSAVRRELMAWPEVRAEVPFFSLGAADADIASFGAYAEGAIDALATDLAHPERALLIDYKTGGSAHETPEQLQEKHALQARVYADVLHKAGLRDVTLVFVRVEIEDEDRPGEPQTVVYHL